MGGVDLSVLNVRVIVSREKEKFVNGFFNVEF